jgi:hypothetical protein
VPQPVRTFKSSFLAAVFWGRISKFCAFYRKETRFFLSVSAMLWLRKEKMLSSEGVPFRRKQKERKDMSNNNNNQINVPQAREAMDKFKMQAASDKGVPSTS